MARKRKRTAGVLVLPPEIIAAHEERFGDEFDARGVQLLFAVRALARRINERANAWLRPFGLTAKDMNYLASLHASGERDVALSELSRLTHSSNAGITQMTDSLEKRGLVMRAPHPDDRRSTVVKLTPKGKELFEEAFVVHNRHIRAVTASVDPSNRAVVLATLAELDAALETPAES